MSDLIEPIFLIGAGRSGTKYLRDILTVSEDVASIPYDVGYVWRYGNESLDHDELTPELLNGKIKKYIRKTLPKLVNLANRDNAIYYIEKSVPNALRPEFLFEIYPDAKFIHLVRDGRSVTESSIRMWSEQPDKTYLLKKLKYFPLSNYRYAFRYISNLIKGMVFSGRGQRTWGPRYKGIENDVKSLPLEVVCAKQWKHCVEISRKQLKRIPLEQVLEVNYESLLNDYSAIDTVCDFIGISDKSKVTDRLKKTAVKSNTDKWREKLTDKSLILILEEIGPLLKELGYD